MLLRSENGFSMIEVMISILVLALGVLGVAGMQMTALRTSQQSAFQTAALQLATDMADRMRANTVPMKLADSANPFLAVDYKSRDGDPVEPGRLCYAEQCDGTDLARFDIYEWQKRIKAALPGGRAVICRDSTPWNTDLGVLDWACNGDAGAGAPIVIKLGWLGKGQNPDGSEINDPAQSSRPGVAITVMPYVQ